jgi:hypothetical protein
MIGVLVGLIGLVVLVAGGAGGYALWIELGLRQLTRQRFIVTVDGDIPFVGYLTHRGRRTYIFERCHTLPEPGATAVPISGRYVIDRPRIVGMQHVITGVDLPPPPNARVGADVSE